MPSVQLVHADQKSQLWKAAFVSPTALASSLFTPSRKHRYNSRLRCPPPPVQRFRPAFRTVSVLKFNRIGNSDLLASEVCLGSMTWGLQNNEEDAHLQMDYAFRERGVNILDTSETYPIPVHAAGHVPGRTERYIGTYFARNPGMREKTILVTKALGYQPNSRIAAARYPDRVFPDGIFPTARQDAQSLRDACEASLRKLQTDYIDLYLLHWPDRYVPMFGQHMYRYEKERKAIPFRDILLGLKPLLDEGKIRHYGLSNETTFGVAEFVRAADELGMPRPVAIENSYCLLDRRFDTELAEACSPQNYNIGLLPWSILAGGTLTGKYLEKLDEERSGVDESLDQARLILYKGYQLRFAKTPAQIAAAEYKKIADGAGVSLATLAQAFCKTRPFISSSIVGATSMRHLKENIDAFEIDLSEEILAQIDEVHFQNKDLISVY